MGLMNARRWIVATLVLLCVLALGATPALAARAKLSAIAEAGGKPFGGLFGGLSTYYGDGAAQGVAVDGSDNLWVGDQAGQVVDKFSSSGAFLTQSSGLWSGLYPGPVAFSNAFKHLYLTDYSSGDVWGLEPSGAYANIDLKGPWGTDVAVAADNSSGTGGDLYLGGGGSVYRIDGTGVEKPFSASKEPYIAGNKLTGFAAGESFSRVVSVAVDSTGDLYVADGGRKAVYEFSAAGEFQHSITQAEGAPFGSISAVAVDPSSGHVLVADLTNNAVDEFASTGAYLDNIEGVAGPISLVVDSTGKLYVTEGNQVGVYGNFTPRIPHPPKIAMGAVSGIGLTSATLNATVNPRTEGEVSECRFEYGTSEAFGQSAPCVPATFSSTTAVSAQLNGLEPDSFYLYRLHVVDPATGPGGLSGPVEGFRTSSPNPVPAGPPATGCANEVSRQGPSALLPDCRAYEQVTPVDKGVAEDMFTLDGLFRPGHEKSFGFASEEGNQFLLTTVAAIGANATSAGNEYVFSRAAGGWGMTSLAAPEFGVQGISQEDSVFNPADLSRVAFEDALEKIGEPLRGDAMVVGRPGGPYESIVVPSQSSEVVGASSDLGHVIVQSTSHELALGAAGQVPGSDALYDWSAGHVSLVNVKSDGTTLVSRCGAILGQKRAPGTSISGGEAHGAVSSDGSKVFFTAPDPGGPAGGPGCWVPGSPEVNPPELYMRVNGSTTVEVSAPEPGVTVKDPTPYAAVYVGASVDGSRVFFLSRGELTVDDPGHAVELYEYNTLTLRLTRVSKGDSGNAVGDVGWVAAVSSDGSTVYFEANGRLAPGAPAGGLYRYDTLTGHTTYITTGSQYPGTYSGAELTGGVWSAAAGIPLLGQKLGPGPNNRADWYATADGRYLVFPSSQPITGYDSGGFRELYRYSAADNSIVCVSCGSSPPVDDALFVRAGEGSPGPQSTSPRPISEDGSRVFFDTASALVPGASAGRVHVYEWHEGAISLLSAPHNPEDSFFLGASADGANVFIGTHAQLVAQDTDNAGDLYDVRIGGGFGEVAVPACTGTGCQGVPSAPPIFATPSSVTFEGLGNFANEPPSKTVTKKTTRCRKGFTKNRKGKCVKKPKPRKRAKKSTHHRGVGR
jgi:hypothetical protein